MLKKLIAFLLVLIALPVSAAPYKPSQGGTGISTTPTYGQLLVGAGNGVYTLMSTSTLGIVGAGTVTSVDMTVPLGLTISGNPITALGTLALSLTDGYVIPKTASTSEWAAAYLWGDHSLVGYLTQAAADLLYQPIGNYLNKDTDTYVVTETDPVWESEKSGYLTSITNLFDQWLDSTSTPIFAGLRLTGLADPAGSFLAVDANGSVIATTSPTGGGGTWGSITGTLSAQTDLQDALDDKAGLDTANTFSLHNIFSSLFATNASTTNLHVVNMNDEVVLNINDALFSTSTPDGLNHRPVGYDTSGFNKYLVFYGNSENDISWDFIYPTKCASTSNAYLDLWVKATTTSNDAVFNALLWRQDEGENVDLISSYDSPNIATSTLSATAGQLSKLTIPLTNRDFMFGGATGRLMLRLSGTSTTSAGYFYVKEKVRFYCE